MKKVILTIGISTANGSCKYGEDLNCLAEEILDLQTYDRPDKNDQEAVGKYYSQLLYKNIHLALVDVEVIKDANPPKLTYYTITVDGIERPPVVDNQIDFNELNHELVTLVES